MPLYCEGVGVLPSVRIGDILLTPFCCEGVGVLPSESGLEIYSSGLSAVRG